MRIRAALVLACATALAVVAPAGAAPVPATFKVGAAALSIDPIAGVPVYAGGFGFSPPITSTAPGMKMEVRAFAVGNGTKNVAMAVVDAQAFFAAYQEGPDYGIASAREQAAAQITQLTGVPTSKTDIIVQSTHSHAGATLQGIWGPVPLAYLKLVHDQTVKALVAAAVGAKPAHLEMGTYDAPWLNNVDIVQTDSYPGWTQDGQLSVLRAVSPAGQPIATFSSIPAHGDIVEGSGIKLLHPDYFGFVRDALDERLGGVNVVGPATLGRNETPIQVGGIEPARWFAGVVTSIVGRAIADGHWLTKDTLASAETFARVPGTNPALFALNTAWKLPDDQKMQLAETSGDTIDQSLYPIDRSMDPPYLVGTTIGTDLTALRIGDNVFLSMPGEPFPEIRNAIASLTTGADKIVALSKGQDDWGYFYPAWVTPATAFYDSDHHIYNIAPHAGDEVIKFQTDNLKALGFATETLAVSAPLVGNRYEQTLRPGLQAMASPTWGDVGSGGTLPVTFTVIYSSAHTNGAPLDGLAHVDFGDGTKTDVRPDKRQRFVHEYTPGAHTVTVSGKDTNGNPVSWQLVVRAYPRLQAWVGAEQIGERTWRFTATAEGGDQQVVRRDWTFSDGETASGETVEHTFGPGEPSATLLLADATTTNARATWHPGSSGAEPTETHTEPPAESGPPATSNP